MRVCAWLLAAETLVRLVHVEARACMSRHMRMLMHASHRHTRAHLPHEFVQQQGLQVGRVVCNHWLLTQNHVLGGLSRAVIDAQLLSFVVKVYRGW